MNFIKYRSHKWLLAVIVLFASACDLEEVNVNPNNATDASINLILPAAQTNLVWAINDFAAHTTSTLVQYLTGTVNVQYNVTVYEYLPANFETTWSTHFYAGAMVDLKRVIEKGTETQSPYYTGIAKIQMAMALGYLVDLWGDVPYSTALDLNTTPAPSFDKGQDVYTNIFQLLDQGIADLNSATSVFIPAKDDIFYPEATTGAWVTNSLPKWKKAANALKARYSNHLSKVDPIASAEDALEAIDAGTFTSSAEELKVVFGSTNDAAGPWFGFLAATFGQNNIGVNQGFIDFLKDRVAPGVNDPRLPFYIQDKGAGTFVGTPYGGSLVSGASKVGPYINTASAPTNLITYFEVKFIEAEAHYRLGEFAEAATAFNDAVKASILRVTGSANAAYEAKFASEDATTFEPDGLEKIFTEKYIAMFLQTEAWTDWRRSIPSGAAGTTSGIPALTPAAINGTNGVFPRRFLYPPSELNGGGDVPVLSLTDKVFWDK